MKRLFLSEYLRNMRTVGAVAPSSKYLAAKMIGHINFNSVKIIVEYGPGTGVFTAAIVAKMNAHTKLIIIEQNTAFYDVLAKKYRDVKNVIVINDSAENVESIMKVHNIHHVDHIISGLPFAALPKDVTNRVLSSTVRLIGNGGSFTTFQYTLFKKSVIKSFFTSIQISYELLNIPPAYIFTCANK